MDSFGIWDDSLREGMSSFGILDETSLAQSRKGAKKILVEKDD